MFIVLLNLVQLCCFDAAVRNTICILKIGIIQNNDISDFFQNLSTLRCGPQHRARQGRCEAFFCCCVSSLPECTSRSIDRMKFHQGNNILDTIFSVLEYGNYEKVLLFINTKIINKYTVSHCTGIVRVRRPT